MPEAEGWGGKTEREFYNFSPEKIKASGPEPYTISTGKDCCVEGGTPLPHSLSFPVNLAQNFFLDVVPYRFKPKTQASLLYFYVSMIRALELYKNISVFCFVKILNKGYIFLHHNLTYPDWHICNLPSTSIFY